MQNFTNLEELKNANLKIGDTVSLDIKPYIIGNFKITEKNPLSNGYSVLDLGETSAVRFFDEYNDWNRNIPKKTLISHKGYSGWLDFETLLHEPTSNGIYPANTMGSITHSIRLGFKFLEIDITMTGDGVWIVSHEHNTLFMQTEKHTRFLDMTYEEISKKPLIRDWKGGGFWHYSDHIAKEYVPTLDEALSFLKQQEGVFVILDCKWPSDYTYTDKDMDSLAEIIKKHDMVSRVAPYAACMNPLCKRLPEATATILNKPDVEDKFFIDYVKSYKNHTIDVSLNAYKSFVPLCKENDIPLTVWFADDYTLVDEGFENGIDYLMTNYCLVNPNLSDYTEIYDFTKDFGGSELVLDYDSLKLRTGDIISVKAKANGEARISVSTIDAPVLRSTNIDLSNEKNERALYYVVNDCYEYDLKVSFNPKGSCALEGIEIKILRETARGEK